MRRTHTCGELTAKDLGKEVTLQGWVQTRRDHGGVIFIDLRDRWGLTQVVFDPQISKESHKAAEGLRREYVIEATGKVRRRPNGMENPKLKTGEVEVASKKLEVLNKALAPPFDIDDRVETNEDIRLKYRYLDLRKPEMQANLLMRHKVYKATRDFFDKEGFIEIETPMLAKSTPEGARDYLVPSRVHPGNFFALPQSPQLFKQLLMVSGFDRYFQIARCFRDEDLRADRQPEFTQIDVEMSFVDEDDIYDTMEKMAAVIWKATLGVELKLPFPRLKYEEAMERFGTDKPDTRFGLELIDVDEVVKKSNFEVFKSVLVKGGIVRCINAKGCAKLSRKDIDELTNLAAIYGAKGLAWMKMEDELESSIVKFFPEGAQKELIKKTKAEKGDLLLFVADKHKIAYDSLGALRLELGRRLKLIDERRWNFVWITDFPLLDWSEEEERYMAMHHPFTSPKDRDLKNLDSAPEKVHAKAYDMVANGVELGGGSIRIHRRETQEKMFKALGIGKEEAERKFGFLMGAFQYGAPPHGGIAFGLDRVVGMITKNESIREVIAFPKNKAAQSLMDDAPSEVSSAQLSELHIELDLPTVEKKSVFERIKEFLDEKNAKYETLTHKPVFTSEEAAEVRGTKLEQGAKALVFKIDQGFGMAVISAKYTLNLENLKKITGAKTIKLATANEVKGATGCSIGAVPPFGKLFGLKVYVDNSLMKNEIIAFNAGSHTDSMKMKCEDYIKALNPEKGDFT